MSSACRSRWKSSKHRTRSSFSTKLSGHSELFRLTVSWSEGKAAPSFNGDSVGHWEGDTLVVDVKNFNGKIWGPGNMKVTSDKYHVVERYTLVGDTLQYQVVIDDPGVLTGPFSPNPTTLRRPPETRIMEYECIENNLNLDSIVQ